MTALINYKRVKKTKNSLCYILLYNKKIISNIKDNSFLEDQLSIINHNIKLAISQNQEISEINLSSRLKIISVSLDSKKKARAQSEGSRFNSRMGVGCGAVSRQLTEGS